MAGCALSHEDQWVLAAMSMVHANLLHFGHSCMRERGFLWSGPDSDEVSPQGLGAVICFRCGFLT